VLNLELDSCQYPFLFGRMVEKRQGIMSETQHFPEQSPCILYALYSTGAQFGQL
jgi:hypothetical protein